MKRLTAAIITLSMIFLILTPSVGASDTQVSAPYAPGEVLVCLKEDTATKDSVQSIEEIAKEYSLEVIDQPVESDELKTTENNENLVLMQSEDDNVEKLCKKLEKNPEIEYAEPNYYLELEGTVEDDYVLPSDCNTSHFINYQKKYFDQLSMGDAYSQRGSTGEGIVVAILDTGVNVNHVEFQGQFWDDGNGNVGYNTALSSYDITDEDGHGTLVAGVVAMKANGIAGLGVAYNSKLMILKVSKIVDGKSVIAVSSVKAGLEYATENGADVINMSLSFEGVSTTLEDAVNEAAQHSVLVAAAGNQSTNAASAKRYPAAYSNVVAVMACASNATELASFSNYDATGTFYQIAAPGELIFGPSMSGGYALASGTSQASPLVAGLAALYMSAYPEKTLSEVCEALVLSPTKTVKAYSSVAESYPNYSFKVINALEVMNYAAEPIKLDPEVSRQAWSDATFTSQTFGNCIYGFAQGLVEEDLSDYLILEENDGEIEIVPTQNGCGTGTKIKMYNYESEFIGEYTIIIFGDANGDAYVDGRDAVYAGNVVMENELGLDIDILSYALDVDFDLTVTDYDCTMISNCGLFTEFISQIR